MLVVPVGQETCCWHRPVQETPASGRLAEPQTEGTPLPPQMSEPVQTPQLAVKPPQPSATGPQLAPAWLQVRGVHDDEAVPQTLAPPPPQNWPAEQLEPQLSVAPQPSAMPPQLSQRCLAR